MFKQLWSWIKGLFQKKTVQEPLKVASKEETERFIRVMEEKQEAERKAKLEAAYRQYRRVMINQSNTPASFNSWIKGKKHPLHSSHFGTFSPVKPIRRRAK